MGKRWGPGQKEWAVFLLCTQENQMYALAHTKLRCCTFVKNILILSSHSRCRGGVCIRSPLTSQERGVLSFIEAGGPVGLVPQA